MVKQKKVLSAQEIAQINEARRARFARDMRASRSEEVLRRIASAYDVAAVEGIFTKSPQAALNDELRNQSLEGYTINGRPITFNQARVIYEMVREGKYGGVPRPQPIAIFSQPSIDNRFPDSICFLASARQTPEEYLADYERRLQED